MSAQPGFDFTILSEDEKGLLSSLQHSPQKCSEFEWALPLLQHDAYCAFNCISRGIESPLTIALKDYVPTDANAGYYAENIKEFRDKQK